MKKQEKKVEEKKYLVYSFSNSSDNVEFIYEELCSLLSDSALMVEAYEDFNEGKKFLLIEESLLDFSTYFSGRYTGKINKQTKLINVNNIISAQVRSILIEQ
jgi:hypothetical protein